MRSLGGLLRLAHVAGHARRAGARTSMVPISEPTDLQDRGTIAALKRRRPGHATATVTIISAWLGVGRHRGTAPPGLPSTSAQAQCSEPVADVTLFRRNKAPKIHQPRTENPCRGVSRFEGSTWLNFSNSAFFTTVPSSEPALNRRCGSEPPPLWS